MQTVIISFVVVFALILVLRSATISWQQQAPG